MSGVDNPQGDLEHWQDFARAQNARLVRKRESDADKIDAVSAACIKSYSSRLAAQLDEHPLHDLTRHLLQTYPETESRIRERFTKKWAGQPDEAAQVEKSVTNSLRRSAGTNYQALTTYALAHRLLALGSTWYVENPVPPEWAHNLSIRFGHPVSNQEDESQTAEVTVKPDLDVLVRNAAWRPAFADSKEPVLVLSIKTSLADRAGAAARWKTYFDLVTNPCPLACNPDCSYEKLGISLANAPSVEITHGIITANIYKINSDPHFAQWGELRSNQAKANTFMFDLRYTTREDSEDVMAPGWRGFASIEEWLSEQSKRHQLPL
jgi:hypothetical protein